MIVKVENGPETTVIGHSHIRMSSNEQFDPIKIPYGHQRMYEVNKVETH